jgi:predicted Zn finger-like uncharacterized protein
MRIVCPACQAAYEVPDKLLTGGARRVRCARCGGDWVPEPVAAPMAQLAPPVEPEPPDVEEAPPPALPVKAAEPEPEPDLPVRMPVAPAGKRVEEKLAPEPPVRAARGMTVVAGLAWAASLALLGAGAWAGIAFRADVMAAWAPSRRLYVLLGLG